MNKALMFASATLLITIIIPSHICANEEEYAAERNALVAQVHMQSEAIDTLKEEIAKLQSNTANVSAVSYEQEDLKKQLKQKEQTLKAVQDKIKKFQVLNTVAIKQKEQITQKEKEIRKLYSERDKLLAQMKQIKKEETALIKTVEKLTPLKEQVTMLNQGMLVKNEEALELDKEIQKKTEALNKAYTGIQVLERMTKDTAERLDTTQKEKIIALQERDIIAKEAMVQIDRAQTEAQAKLAQFEKEYTKQVKDAQAASDKTKKDDELKLAHAQKEHAKQIKDAQAALDKTKKDDELKLAKLEKASQAQLTQLKKEIEQTKKDMQIQLAKTKKRTKSNLQKRFLSEMKKSA